MFAGADDPADAAVLARLLAPAGATPARLDHWLGWALLGVLRAVGAAPVPRGGDPPQARPAVPGGNSLRRRARSHAFWLRGCWGRGMRPLRTCPRPGRAPQRALRARTELRAPGPHQRSPVC